MTSPEPTPYTTSLVAHIPVISRAYLEFIEENQAADQILVVDESIASAIDGIRKDVRRLEPQVVVSLLGLCQEKPVLAADIDMLRELRQDPEQTFILPDDEISKYLIETIPIPDEQFALQSLFLRWNRLNIAEEAEIEPAHSIHFSELPPSVIQQLQSEINQANDWWRQVGCVIFKDDNIIQSGHNHYLPNEHSAEIDGDIRSQLYRGVGMELGNAQHAEASAVAAAAKKGIVLEGSECLVGTFPCPTCAKLLAESGIKTLYYVDGYTVSDGLLVLKSADIEIVKVNELILEPTSKTSSLEYKGSTQKS